MNEPKKHDSPLIKELLNEVSPLEMEICKVKMQLAARLEDLMLAKGWSKKQFAEKLGKNPSEITKWLSGTHNFTLAVLAEICMATGTDWADLFKRETVHYYSPKEIRVKQNATQFVYIPSNDTFKEIDKQHPWVCTFESTNDHIIYEKYD